MNMITKIEILFPTPAPLRGSAERALDAIASAVCEDYQAAHPDRVMWPSAIGAPPTAAFFADAPGEQFESGVFQIACSEREDFYGNNPHNPRRAELKEIAATDAALRRKQQLQSDLAQLSNLMFHRVPGLTASMAAACAEAVLIPGGKEVRDVG